MAGILRTRRRLSARRRARVALSLAVMTGAADGSLYTSTESSAAPAYPQDPNNCNDSSIMWRFETNSGWTKNGVDRRPWVRAAINTLDDARDYNGSPLVSVTEHASIGVEVQVKDKPMNQYGSAECVSGASFWVNGNYTSSKFYWHVARHEMMHLMGAEHGGNIDSKNGDNPPTMMTCKDWSTFRSVNTLAQDDAAYLNWLHSGRDYRQLHANYGWEQGTSYWGKTAGALSYKSSGGSLGPGYAAWQAPTGNDYLYQTVAVHTGDDNESYRAITAAKSLSPDYKTAVRPALYRRNIAHQSSNSCEYADGVGNPNDYSVTSGWVLVAQPSSTVVGTGWTGVQSAFSNPANAMGYEMQVRIYGVAVPNSGGATGYIGIDNSRGDGT